MHIIYALMLMTCFSGKTCKQVVISTYPDKDNCVQVANAIHQADDTILGTCQKVVVGY